MQTETIRRAEQKAIFADALDTAVYQTAAEQLSNPRYTSTDINRSRSEGYAIYGGLLFLGIFFAILFLVNTVLIMYFKQVNEGYEDRARFVILQKVGMSDSEVKHAINKQVLVVFFLPLLMALFHMLAAGNLITQILSAFVMTNNTVTFLSIAVTCVIFTAVYIVVFRQTAKVYYRLVKW